MNVKCVFAANSYAFENFQIESTLTERAIRAENLAETAEKKKVALEDEVRGEFALSMFPKLSVIL